MTEYIVEDMGRHCEGCIVSREEHNRTIYIRWHTGRCERLGGEVAEALWHLPNDTHFNAEITWSHVERGDWRVKRRHKAHSIKNIETFILPTLEEMDAFWEEVRQRSV